MDLVDHGRTGLLVPPGDADAVTGGVRLLAGAPGLRQEFGQAGRADVEGRTWAAVGDLLLGHYDQVLSARTAVAA
jgi:phosphatidylinositol alpha 1,6-mannosyltransferase